MKKLTRNGNRKKTTLLPSISITVLTSEIARLTFTCSKSTIETAEKGVKYVQS